MLAVSLAVALYAFGAAASVRRFNFTLHSASRSPGKSHHAPATSATVFYADEPPSNSFSADGFEREVYLINGQQPGPLIDVDEGDDVEIFVRNDLNVETTMHWHGLLQRGTPNMDGVPGVTQDPIQPGGNFTYRFTTSSEYGYFWYHSHFRAYYNDAIRGPLLIRPAASRTRPFESLARDDKERAALLEAERQATNVLLNDWTHELSDVVFARYTKTGAFPFCVDSILANGRGRVWCLPKQVLQAAAGPATMPEKSTNAPISRPTTPNMPGISGMVSMSGMASVNAASARAMHDMMADMWMSGMVAASASTPAGSQSMAMPTPSSPVGMMPDMSALGPRGCTPPMMFKPGFNMSSLPPETCTNTSSPLLVIPANQTTGWLALNLVNSGAASALRVSLDGHSMLVYAADGLYVKPQQVKVLHVELGQRYSVMIKLDQQPDNYNLRFATYPSGDMQQVLEGYAVVSYSGAKQFGGNIVQDVANSWMLINGSAKAGATLLDPMSLAPFQASIAPPAGPAARTLSFAINQTDIVSWVIDRTPFREPKVPVIYGNLSAGWDASTTKHLPLNSTIDIVLNVSNQSMDTMGHPMHLHGHKFWVLGSGRGSFPYNSVADAAPGVLNLRDPPFRDTTGLPSQGWAVIRYVTDNPGAWIFHCHLQWHVVVGMAVVLVEGGNQLPALVGQYNITVPPNKSDATGLMVGGLGNISIALVTMLSFMVGFCWY